MFETHKSWFNTYFKNFFYSNKKYMDDNSDNFGFFEKTLQKVTKTQAAF